MVIRLPGGSNSGGSSGGGAPTGAAGGSLTGTYPNPTIATIPSGATATTQTAADGSTKVATTAYVDTADALKANLAGPTFTGAPTLPTGTVATTQVATVSNTTLATTAYVMAKENAFILGKAGAIGATETDAADFVFVVPYNCTILRMKAALGSAATGAMIVQLRTAAAPITTAPAMGNVSSVLVTFANTNVLATATGFSTSLTEGDFLNFSCSTGSGSNLLVEVVVTHR